MAVGAQPVAAAADGSAAKDHGADLLAQWDAWIETSGYDDRDRRRLRRQIKSDPRRAWGLIENQFVYSYKPVHPDAVWVVLIRQHPRVLRARARAERRALRGDLSGALAVLGKLVVDEVRREHSAVASEATPKGRLFSARRVRAVARPRERRGRRRRTSSRAGPDSDDPEPPGVAPGGGVEHVSVVLDRYLAELWERAA